MRKRKGRQSWSIRKRRLLEREVKKETEKFKAQLVAQMKVPILKLVEAVYALDKLTDLKGDEK